MNLKTQSPITKAQVKDAFVHWRRTRSKKCRIPEELWDMAIALTAHHTPSQVATLIGQSSVKVMERMASTPVTVTSKPFHEQSFIQVDWHQMENKLPQPVDGPVSVNFVRKDGATMGINYPSVHSLNENALISSFLGGV